MEGVNNLQVTPGAIPVECLMVEEAKAPQDCPSHVQSRSWRGLILITQIISPHTDISLVFSKLQMKMHKVTLPLFSIFIHINVQTSASWGKCPKAVS